MAPPSVYRYFWPFSIPLFLSGQFPVNNVFSHSADLLRFRFLSIPVIAFCVFEFVAGSYLLIVMRGQPLYYTVVFTAHFSFKYLTLQWTKLKTNLIIQSFQELDKLRQCSYLIPSVETQNRTNYFLWIAFGIFFGIPLSSFTLFYLFPNLIHSYSMEVLFMTHTYFYYIVISHYRMIVLVSIIFYFCSLAVVDLIMSWDIHVAGFLNSRNSLREFCTLLEKEKVIIRKLTTLLGGHFVVIIVELVARLLLGVCADIEFDSAEVVNIFNILQSVALFWFMLSTISQPSLKFQELSYEVFTTGLNKQDLTRRDAARIKMILVQLEDNPGEVDTAGYGSLDRSVFLWYLCLSIEFLIFLWQNNEVIRDFSSKMG